MKIRDRGVLMNLLVVATAGILWGCKGKPAEEVGSSGAASDQQEVAVSGGPQGMVEQVEEKASPPEKELPKWTRESAGYSRYLPQDTDMYLEVRKLDVLWDLFGEFDAEEVMERLKLDEMAEATGEDAEKIEEFKKEVEEGVREVFPAIFGEEVFVSVRGLDWWLQPYLHYSEVLYPDFVGNLVKEAANGNWLAGGGDGAEMEAVYGILDFVQKQIELVDGKPLLAVQMGGRVSENRAEVMTRLQDWMDLAASEQEIFGKVEFEQNGVTWSGIQVDWADQFFEEVDLEELDELDEEERAKLIEIAEDLPIVMVCGEVGDYVVLSVGLGEHSAETVVEGKDSLVAEEGFEFLSGFELDSVLGVSWVSRDLVESYQRTRSWVPIWEGMAKGFAKGTRLKSGPEVAASFREVAKLARAKNAGKAFDEVGALVLKDEMHFESRGGWLSDGVDLASPMKLAAAFDRWENPPFFRAHWMGKKEHSDMTLAQFEELAKVVQAIGDEISEVVDEGLEEFEEELDEDDLAEAEKERQLADLMRRDFLKGVEGLWLGYRDHFRESLGSEVAMVMDLDGAAPPIFGLDEETLENGRIPRFAYVRSVRDREGLQKAWDLWRDSGVRFFGLMSEAFDTPIPFPDMMSADSNELRTHFFPMPFATDDFLPSLSVSDEIFVVGSAKSLAAKIDKAMRGPLMDALPKSGMLVELEMGQFWDFCEAWLQVGVENWGSVKKMTEEDVQWAIDKARWWKGVSYRRWLDDGVPRSSASLHWGDPAEESE